VEKLYGHQGMMCIVQEYFTMHFNRVGCIF
jgi:hypothetical protein